MQLNMYLGANKKRKKKSSGFEINGIITPQAKKDVIGWIFF
jgi:hypothetical protein